jgi:hypothetical protein
MPVTSPGTSASLLDQARGRHADAWDRLVALYTPLLDSWLTAAGLPEHRHMERLCALKVIHPGLPRHPTAAQRFQQEVRAAARLHPPNIATAYDADQAGGLHFLVVEHVEGTPASGSWPDPRSSRSWAWAGPRR